MSRRNGTIFEESDRQIWIGIVVCSVWKEDECGLLDLPHH